MRINETEPEWSEKFDPFSAKKLEKNYFFNFQTKMNFFNHF
jgi:hypothetical protein